DVPVEIERSAGGDGLAAGWRGEGNRWSRDGDVEPAGAGGKRPLIAVGGMRGETVPTGRHAGRVPHVGGWACGEVGGVGHLIPLTGVAAVVPELDVDRIGVAGAVGSGEIDGVIISLG